MQKISKVILLLDPAREDNRGFLRGISKYCQIFGPWSLYSGPSGESKVLPKLENWGANGIIARVNEPKQVKEIAVSGIPAICIRTIKDYPEIPNITDDAKAQGLLAAEHFLSRRFKNFAYCGFSSLDWSINRRDAFVSKLAEKGFDTHILERPRQKVSANWKDEQILLADWLKSLPGPVAVLACNDERGRQIIEACKIAELHIPERVAVLGIDNDEFICGLSTPPLSSIVRNTERAGYEAAELLSHLMNGVKMKGQKVVVHSSHIVTRQSTDILAIEDEDVVEAIRFIRDHYKEPIQVSDVLEAVAMSRRNLELRFRKALGHSILTEIRHMRVQHIAKMLVETNQSILQISLSCGHSGVRHISRFFKKEHGVSLLEYRKRYGMN